MAAPQYETGEPVLYALADGIATLTLNRPRYGNAQNSQMTYALDAAFRRVLFVEFADCVTKYGDLLVGHEFGIGNLDDRHGYFPIQLGLRFSAKASEPSRASALTKTGPINCACSRVKPLLTMNSFTPLP